MDDLISFPDAKIRPLGPASQACLDRGWTNLRQAALGIRTMDYGVNSLPLHPLSLLQDGVGTCVTKHALLATCALELGVPIAKAIGIYAMDDSLVTGVAGLLAPLGLTCVPASHCFLVWGPYRFDLTEGNCNGKNHPIDSYLWIEATVPLPSEEEEQRIFHRGLEVFLSREGLSGHEDRVLQAKALCSEHLHSLLACRTA